MKKRNRLGLISSILGVFALCGLSALAIFSKLKRTQTVSASMNQSTLQNVTIRLDTNYTTSDFNSLFSTNYPTYTDTFTNQSYNSIFYNITSYSGTTYFYDVSTYFGESYAQLGAYQVRFKIAIDLLHDVTYRSSGSSISSTLSEVYSICVINPNADYNYRRPAFLQTYAFSLGTEVSLFCTSFPVYSYTESDINFISGNDIDNPILLNIFNAIGNFVGFNTFSDDVITAAQYEEMIASLEEQISILNGENNDLIVQSQTAYEDGYNAGVNSQTQWVEQNTTTIYNQGYTDGYNNGSSQDETVGTIFSGILQVAFVPVNFFLSIFNFEILGINLSGFIRAIFTVAITIIVIKMISGKGGDS